MKRGIIIIALALAFSFTACSGETKEAEIPKEAVAEDTVKVEPTKAPEAEPTEEIKEELQREPIPEVYSEIAKGFSGKQNYALVDLGLNEKCLLVSDFGVEYLGVNASIYADVYGVGNNGSIVDFGHIESDGSGYVLKVESPYIYVSGGHHIELLYPNVETGTLDIYEGARIEFGETTDTYFYTKDGVEKEVEDMTEFESLFERYSNAAEIIEFSSNY